MSVISKIRHLSTSGTTFLLSEKIRKNSDFSPYYNSNQSKIYQMKIDRTGIYHVFNRGNYKQQIFYSTQNYYYFLRKCHQYIKPVAEILAWNLMPAEFDLLLEITDKSLLPIKQGFNVMPVFSNAIRLLESTYARGINSQMHRSGNLFQQKTKSQLEKQDDAIKIFDHIHQATTIAGLVSHPADWPYSSYPDYIGIRNGNLCNIKRASELLDLMNLNSQLPINRSEVLDIAGVF
jgi:REP element-mobilizing transposase RayT